MSFQNNLEIHGSLREHSAAELFVEIARAKLNGSLRLSNGAGQKSIVYFDAGDAVFAVSNARRFRLFELLLKENKITKEQLAAIADFTDDLRLRENLIESGFFSKADADRLVAKQIETILKDAFGWRAEKAEGEWIFSPLVRIKGDIRFEIGASALLLEHARSLSDETVCAHLEDARETFKARASMPAHVDLTPEEAFVFSRFETAALDAERAAMFSGLPAPAARRIIYTLWLAGFLERADWRNAPFSERSLAAIRSANLTLKKSDAPPPPQIAAPVQQSKTDSETPVVSEAENVAPPKDLTLEAYLRRAEEAPNYYAVFSVAPDAPVADIKRSYFALAKRFHPDLFQRELEASEFKRVQNAFTRIAQGYETLKNEKSREVYDYKMRKELEQGKTGAPPKEGEERNLQMRAERAAEDFETGFSLFMDENFADAVPFLARAVHLVSDVARYRAYYGKALAATDASQKHKAESELQAAIRIEPNSADFRFMLAEFFVSMNLPRRAEGELNRLILMFPGNGEAKRLLESLTKKQ